MTTRLAGSQILWEAHSVALKLATFRPKLSFTIDAGAHWVRTVTRAADLFDVLLLRYEVFLREELGRREAGLDFDQYDLLADHVVVQEKDTGAIIATYRLISSSCSDRFYSQSEFELGRFLDEPGVKLELGRACVRKDRRNGMAIGLIWRGVARYAAMVGADYLFGCSTVWTSDARVAKGVLEGLKPTRFSDCFGIAPRPGYEFPDWPEDGLFDGSGEAIPSLMRAYLAAGARVHGRPALDRAFQCSDFLTILNLKSLHPRVAARFFSDGEA